MAELHTLVEHEMERAGSPTYSFEDLARRRDRRQRNRRIAAGVVALALATLVIGAWIGAVALDRSTPAEPDVTPSPAGLPSAPEAWTRVSFPSLPSEVPGLPSDEVLSIAPGGPGLVALGTSSSREASACWTSPDGRAWSLVGAPCVGGAILDVTTGGPGLIAVGSQAEAWRAWGGDDAPVWTSTDGVTWDEAPADPVFRGALMRAVDAGVTGFVAVGSTSDGQAAWYSSDGVRWEGAAVPPTPPGVYREDGRADAWMKDVAAIDGRLVAVGRVGIEHRDAAGNVVGVRYHPVIWTSTDGVTWTTADTDAFPSTATVTSVTAGPGGFVAVGGDEGPTNEPRIWTSPDGVSWASVARDQAAFASLAPVPSEQDRFDLYLEIHSVIGTSAGYIAVGQDGWCIYGSPFLCEPAAAALWTSPDGRIWTRVGADPRFELGRQTRVISAPVAVWGDRLVAAANHGGGTDIWISEGPEGV